MHARTISPAVLSALAAVTAISALSFACADGPTQPFGARASQASVTGTGADPDATCSPLTLAALRADNGALVVGEVRTGNDESAVLVTVETKDGWAMTKSQLFVGTSAADIPTSGGGNPTPGRFPYTSVHRGGTTSYTYEVPLGDVGVGPGETVVIAVHADVQLGGRTEGAWAEGDPITAQGSWGTWFVHELADCVSALATPETGGELRFGNLELIVPPGAVAADVQLTVREVDVNDLELPGGGAAAGGSIAGTGLSSGGQSATGSAVLGNVIAIAGTAYDLGPDGLQFLLPATLTIHYQEINLPPDVTESMLGLFAINGIFFALESTVHEEDDYVTAQLDHFSTYFVGAQVGTVDLRLKGFGLGPATKTAGFPTDVHATAENLATSSSGVAATLRIDFDELVLHGDLPDGCTASTPLEPDAELRFECALGVLDPGQEASRTVTVTPHLLRTWKVTATVLPVVGDPTPEDNDQFGGFTTEAAVVDLEADMVAPAVVDPGELFLVQGGVQNDGAEPLPAGAVLWIEVAGDAALVSSDCTDFGSGGGFSIILQCSVGELAPGAGRQFAAGIQAGSPGQVITTRARAVVPTYALDGNAANDIASADTRVRSDLEADLSVVFTDITLETARAGLDYGYFLRVASAAASAGAVTGATLELEILGVVTVSSIPAGCSSSSLEVPASTTITCPLPELTPGATLPDLLLIVEPASVEIGNTLNATATVALPVGGVDPNPDDNTATHLTSVVAAHVDMYVAQFTESADPVELGATVRYTIQAGNRTSATDPVPDGSSVDLVVPSGDVAVAAVPAGCIDISGAVADAVRVRCQTGLLDFGELSPAYEIELEPLATGVLELYAEARLSAGAIDDVPADNTQHETTTVEAAAPSLTGTLLFRSDRNTAEPSLWTKDVATGIATEFKPLGNWVFGEDPAWSPDGNTIVIGAFGGLPPRLVAANGASAPVELDIGGLPFASHPRWSPDGTKIVFEAWPDFDPYRTRELYILDLGTGVVTPLTSNAVDDEFPHWSPDGSLIVFVRDGNSIRTITPAGLNEAERQSGTGIRHARWSPDGTEIVFSRQEAVGWSIVKFALTDPGNPVTLVNDGLDNSYPTWSPDGLYIAFVKDDPAVEDPDIYYIRADGTGGAALLHGEEFETDIEPDWK